MEKIRWIGCVVAVICIITTPSAGEDALYPQGKIFPLVMYDVTVKDFAEVKAAGFNCVHMYHSTQSLDQAKQYLEAARTQGLFVMQNMPSRFIEKPKEWWESWVKELSTYDNLAWWYIPEEKPAEKTRHISEAARASDPRHRPRATYLAWNSEEVLGGFAGLLDMLIKSSYPTDYKQPRINVVSWVTNVRNAKLLSIACAELFGKNNGPTEPKLKFDQYAAIVAGSRGMAWYKWSGGATLRKDLLEEAKRFAWEMNGKDNPTPLGQVVLSEDVPQSVRVRAVSGPTESPSTYFYSADRRADIQKSWPSILTLERQWRGHTYVFAVNAAEVYPGKSSYTDATVKAAFLNLPPTVSKAEVLFEKRILKVTKGAFEDDFNELGVHIY